MGTFQARLQNLRQRKYRTIKAFAEAYGCSPSKASGILNGKYHFTLSKDEVKHLADVLGVSFIECADACDNTFADLKGYRGDDWKRTARTHKGIWERWRYVDELLQDTEKAARTGDWTEYRRKHMHEQKQTGGTGTQSTPSPIRETCFTILGIPTYATYAQVMSAFRRKVKAASDGKGGYAGDMDKLTRAKEEALRSAMGRM